MNSKPRPDSPALAPALDSFEFMTGEMEGQLQGMMTRQMPLQKQCPNCNLFSPNRNKKCNHCKTTFVKKQLPLRTHDKTTAVVQKQLPLRNRQPDIPTTYVTRKQYARIKKRREARLRREPDFRPHGRLVPKRSGEDLAESVKHMQMEWSKKEGGRRRRRTTKKRKT